MAHDVFISYSSKDKAVADAACAKLESRDIRCWIAPRDVLAGKPFAASLLNAIRESQVFVLILSEESNRSVHVLREVSQAVDSGIPIVPFRIADIELSEEMYYYIKSIHWLDAMSPPLERHLSKLVETVQALLSVGESHPAPSGPPSVGELTIKREISSRRFIGITAILFIAGALGWIFIQKILSEPSTQDTTQNTSKPQEPNSTEVIVQVTQTTDQNTPKAQEPIQIFTLPAEPTSLPFEQDKFEGDFNIHMVPIPAGSFQMGSNFGDEDERPEHQVYLDAYYIDVYEVTNELYARFLNEMGNKEEGGESWLDASRIIFQSTSGWVVDPLYADHPVVMVSWHGASAFCEWRGARLPTEAEWEKAARGGLEGKLYPWGDDLPTYTLGMENGAQFGDHGDTTVPVGSFAPNDYGLYDLAGNVIEWVADWYTINYYAESPSENPKGPTISDSHVIRGGSWVNDAYELRVSSRHWGFPNAKYTNYGLRCVRSQ
jgi:formylglycine-generating enzyme required for sulfatase activity